MIHKLKHTEQTSDTTRSREVFKALSTSKMELLGIKFRSCYLLSQRDVAGSELIRKFFLIVRFCYWIQLMQCNIPACPSTLNLREEIELKIFLRF